MNTLSDCMQKAAEDAVKSGLSSIGKRAGAGVEAALVAIDIKTGHVKSYGWRL